MNKEFSEVFPTLKMNQNEKLMFDEVQVEKITTNSSREFLNIHIVSTHVIPKKSISEMEKSIENQLFSGTSTQVRIYEQYELSRQYTPQNLLKEYWDSILFELGEQSVVSRAVMREAKLTFENEKVLNLTLAKSIVSTEKEEFLVEYLMNLFLNRFQLPIEINIDYSEPKKSRMKRHNEIKLEQELEAIREKEKSVEENKEKENKVNKEVPQKEKKANYYDKRKSYVQKDDPTIIYGKSFENEGTIEISQLVDQIGEVIIRGQIIEFEAREIRNEKTIIIFSVTDFTDTISAKMFVKNSDVTEIVANIKKGVFVQIKGNTMIDKYDGELTIGSIWGIRSIPDFTSSRMDIALKKRVELHCHTKMSDMDGVSNVKDLVRRAHDWGHKAIAITDHGVIQAFPDANHYIETLPKEDPFKVIYGVEAYLVDDLVEMADGATNETFDDTFVVFDLETTGLSNIKDKIIEIGAVKISGGKIVDSFSTFVNPERPIPYEITKLTSIDDNMVIGAPTIEKVLPDFLDFVGDAILVAHNAGFDVGFIKQNCRYQDIEREFLSLDTVAIAQVLLPTISRYRLNNVAKTLGITLKNHHRAVDDAECTAEIFLKFIEMLKERNITTLQGLNSFGSMNPDGIRKKKSYHAIILVKNDIGRVNLYTLISKSHLTYFGRQPRIPKSEFNRHREGLIIGSACEAGELYQAILNEKSDQVIAKLCHFYDYLEIQPLGNNRFMIPSEKVRNVHSEEDLKEINAKIVALGERFKKPVVATCDVHFLDPEDEVYRRIIMTGKGFSDADDQAPLYLRTTDEMLEEFEYLGSEKAYEVVVENPEKISDSIEKISPVRPDKCPPVIPNSDQDLRDICYTKAHKMYGENLPDMVVERLERELNSIISNGFAVMYIIAQKLVWKSNEDGYLVGSRGSVGSSFVATMAGITEVNPLSPHYYCSKCHYSDFVSDEVKKFAGGCGWDMPDKVCPECGEPLAKDGFDIPFETFLGFKGNKEPDIDLNFSGDYQANAHKYTEVIFGEGQTFKAGTIGTLADKTAYGFVKNYYEERGNRKRNCEIDRIAKACTGIRRSTGQHPGGIIVLPHGEDINSFTPVQRPANDMTTDIVTTHFDYHSIDHNLLKLDILGHDDPTMIKALEEYINSDALENEYDGVERVFKATNIKLDDSDVMSLFADTKVLGIKPSDIDDIPVGCLGIPEFGTEFVIQMVVDTKPKTLSDLIRISGLSHGTNVWLGNAQTLIKEGKATISTAICTRDDIMTYLINMGMDSELSFTIMESVRKGKGLQKEWEEAMIASNIPDWYIESCKKISYMFPKAHAAAYVMMAYRIAYCKINYPLAYYGAYFGIRADAFSYELMCMGRDRLKYYMEDYKRREKSDDRSKQLTNKEQATLKDMKIVLEMYARGFEFLPLDIYRAKATKFQIIDGKLMPPFSSIDGMGDKAAEAVEEASKEGKYLSLDDFRQRTKVSKTVIDFMKDLGLFGDLPETNQLSLFD